MTALPSWADTPEGRALADRIRREQPDFRITRGGWLEGGGQRRYRGRAAGQLRRLRSDLADKLCVEADAAFRRGEPWESAGAEFNALLASETADELIARLCPDAQLTEIHNIAPGRIAA